MTNPAQINKEKRIGMRLLFRKKKISKIAFSYVNEVREASQNGPDKQVIAYIGIGRPVAVNYLSKAVKLHPENAELYKLLGISRLYNTRFYNGRKGFNKKAIQDFTKAIELDPLAPENIESYRVRGLSRLWWGFAHERMHDFQGAIDDFGKVLKLNPNDQTSADFRRTAELALYEYAGDAKVKLEDYPSAIQYYNKVIEVFLKDSKEPYYSFSRLWKPYYKMGVAKVLSNDFEGAILDFNKSIECDDIDEVRVMLNHTKWLSVTQGPVSDWERVNVLGNKKKVGFTKNVQNILKVPEKHERRLLRDWQQSYGKPHIE